MPIHHILTIEFDEAGLEALRTAGLRVAITRSVEPARPERVVWMSFFPRLVSTVTWTESDVRFFFCGQWPLVPGATVFVNSSSETLTPGGVYSFAFRGNGMGGFVELSEDGAADRYTLINREETRVYAFGLAEVGTLFSHRDETKLRPLNVAPLAPNSRIPFLVTKKVQVFTSAAEPSVILGDEPHGEILELDFAESLVWKIRYDNAARRFVPVPAG